MPEVTLTSLRSLRDKVTALLADVYTDLKPFVKRDDGTFRRKPDSREVRNDINVTTTCSCLMALALTDSFEPFASKLFQGRSTDETAEDLLRRMMAAPWMSSGLSDNNAFTTSLVLRAYGFLWSEGLLSPLMGTLGRHWELNLDFLDAPSLAKILHSQSDRTASFIWLSLSDLTRDGIGREIAGNSLISADLERGLALDLRRIVESGWIYGPSRFPKASTETKDRLKDKPTGYQLAAANRRLLSDQYPKQIAPVKFRTLDDIAKLIARQSNNFAINSYQPSAAVVYWFVDGVARARIQLPAPHWAELCSWATKEFNRARSLVVSEHSAMMDPVAMGMAACLCARLRQLCDDFEPGTSDKHRSLLPSRIELNHAVRELVKAQTGSGIWHKYFPLFHYQDAGSNFCFAFELLEAVLCEFGKTHGVGAGGTTQLRAHEVMDDPPFIEALEKAVNWCVLNRLKCSERGVTYTGWNSGGQLQTLEKGYPESWATAVVHMFLSELNTVLAQHIQRKVLQKYRTTRPLYKKRRLSSSESAVGAMLDIPILLPGSPTQLSTILTELIVDKHRRHTESSLRRKTLKGPLSALLFGPPGTSKTQVTRAIASGLNWPLIEITPADFVKGKLENVYLHANEIFQDLMDLSGVVVFFDEMDALVQTRDGSFRLDIASQFLTTMMLPKLTELHDQARVVFFMATNFQSRFDPAIKRSGRFDLLLCMGPPTLDQKLDKLYIFFDDDAVPGELALASTLIRTYTQSNLTLRDKLELFTFGEFKTFFNKIGTGSNIGTNLRNLTEQGFRSKLEDYAAFVTLKMEDLDSITSKAGKIKSLVDAYNLQLSLKEEEKETAMIRYLCDRRESKDQQ